jgi:hypothetical protein
MDYRIQGLSPTPFMPLYGLSDDELAGRNAKRYIADSKPGFPDRVEMRDAEPGERLILVNYVKGFLQSRRSTTCTFITRNRDVTPLVLNGREGRSSCARIK